MDQNLTNESLITLPISLSVFLNPSKKDNSSLASGNVYIDADTENQNLNQYFDIRVKSGIMTFKQLNNGTGPSISKKLDKIVISNSPTPINAACALHRDFQTVQTLNATSLSTGDFN